MNKTDIKGVTITLTGHASIIIISYDTIIYIDPYIIPQDSPTADIILITHNHYDHCAPDKIDQITDKNTKIIAPKNCAEKINQDIKEITTGNTIDIDNIKITAVPAYNRDKPFHPKGTGVGYIIGIDGVKIYHAGDTDHISEMRKLKDEKIDIACLPVGGTYTMDIVEASDAVKDIVPKVVIPMHYGTVEGTTADIDEFKKLVKKKAPDVEVRVL